MFTRFLRKNLKFLFASISLLALFYAFSFFLVKGGGLNRFDFDMTVRIQDKIPIKIDPYFSLLSLIGSFEGTMVILLGFLGIMRKLGSVITIGMFCLMHVVELLGKAYLDHPSTPFMFHRYSFDFVFPTGYVQPGGSYPSGHAMRTAFLAILFIFVINRTKFSNNVKFGIWVLVLGIYIAMCISRISLGEHWTSDVIGGSILGAAFSFLSLAFL